MRTHNKFNIRSFALAAGVALAGIAFACSARAEDWHPDFLSAQQMAVAAGVEEINFVSHLTPGLPSFFTAQEYGAAQAEDEIASLRVEYDLGPNFTSAELEANAGAKEVAALISRYHLPTHFSAAQFRTAIFQGDLKDLDIKNYPQLSLPFSSDDYIAVVGADRALSIATDYELPTQWVYSDLFAAAGPREAASIRNSNHFAKGATHQEIEQAIGRRELEHLVEFYKIPAAFTARELAGFAPPCDMTIYLEGIVDLNGLGNSFTDADLVAKSGAYKLNGIIKDLGAFAPKGPFTEQDLRKAFAAEAIDQMRRTYDLDANFTSADIARAAGQSKVVETRQALHLRPDFTAAEYEAAWRAKDKADRVARAPLMYMGAY